MNRGLDPHGHTPSLPQAPNPLIPSYIFIRLSQVIYIQQFLSNKNKFDI